MTRNFAWLIEHAESEYSKPLYFCGWRLNTGYLTPIKEEIWSFNSLEAVRFSRQDGASKIACWLTDDQRILHRICEHGWE